MQTQSEQPQQTQPLTKEEVEKAIEVCKERVDDQQYELRWFRRFMRAFWTGVVTTIVCFAVLYPLNIPFLQTLVETVGGIAIGLAAVSGFCIVVYAVPGNELWEELGNLREARRELDKLQGRLKYFEEQALRHLTAEQYMHQLPTLIASYRQRADRYRRLFTAIQLTTIFLSAAITSLSGGWLDRYFTIPWIIPVLSALISILTSVTLFFKFREKGTNLQQTADKMDWEHMACTLGIGSYKGRSQEEKLVMLAERAEELRQEQQKRQLQLEQSSQTEQKALQAHS